ncbi:MAG: type II toxin-antitoxin system VapC family toxin, partial [Nitrospira sp.]|nr:type II toxin-antitoxin system VapC family toxin [Nitrospira sp.]
MARLLLDTDVLIEYLRGREEAVSYLESLGEDLAVSAITVAELYAGVRGETEREALDRFMGAFVVIPVTQEVAVAAGDLRRRWGPSHGTDLPDAILAATAESNRLPLVTFNVRHYPMLANVAAP